jgi:transcriptional regulator with XRE-family HTH domain
MPSKPTIIDTAASKRFILVRKHLNLNQTEMAEVCKISQSAVAKIEGGVLDIPQAVMKVLYVSFGISPIYLVAGEPPMVHTKSKVNTLVRDIPEMQADIEILKGQVKLLTGMIGASKSPTSLK